MGNSSTKEDDKPATTPDAHRKHRSLTVSSPDPPANEQLMTENNQIANNRSNRHSKIKKTKGLPSQTEFKTIDTVDEMQVVSDVQPQKHMQDVEVEEMAEAHPIADTVPVRRNKKFRPSSIAES